MDYFAPNSKSKALISQNHQAHTSPNKPLASQNQGYTSSNQLLTQPNHQPNTSPNQPFASQNQPLISSNQPLISQNQRHTSPIVQEFFDWDKANQKLQRDILSRQKNIVCGKAQIKIKEFQLDKARRKEITLDQQILEHFQNRQKINSTLQQIRGNVRVFCRLRPADLVKPSMDYQVTQNLITIRKDKKQLKSNNYTSQWEFLFEKVFDQDSTQQLIFNQLSDLVQCSIDGKNVCIFAYGQTGSGKTYTMNGSLEKQDWHHRGFVPRSIDYIFEKVEIGQTKGYKYKISISVNQIYRDKQRDLLNKNESKPNNLQGKEKSTTGGNKQLVDLQYNEVRNSLEAISLLKEAIKSRATSTTNKNNQSSRSHLIFQIQIESEHLEQKNQRTSSLVLVDLAGSQKYNDAGTQSSRQEESTSINKSLSALRPEEITSINKSLLALRQEESKSINSSLTALKTVIIAIKNGEKPSFRSNVLTSALKEQLEGDSQVVMFVNVSTEKRDLEQSIHSLNFANDVRKCQIKKEGRRSKSLNHSLVPNPYSEKENIPNQENQDVDIDRPRQLPSEQMIPNEQKVNQLSKEMFLKGLELLKKYDPDLVKQILRLKEAYQERQRESIRIQNVRPQNIPVSIVEGQGFLKLTSQEVKIGFKKLELDNQLELVNKRIEEKQKTKKIERFEIAIIKMQFDAHSFNRCGGRVVQSDYFTHNMVKWDAQIDVMDIMDLKIFVIATLVPMSQFVFSDFSSQANVYKVLFGFGQNLGSEEIKQSFDILRNRIQKRRVEQKFPPVNSCVNDGKKKKIIFVCKPDTFNDLMDQLIKNIKNFYTQLMVIHNVTFTMIGNKLFTTKFQVGKLVIDYAYEGDSVKTEIQILYCTFENITKKDFDLARRKIVKEESVFIWVDFPVKFPQDMVDEIVGILQTCVCVFDK